MQTCGRCWQSKPEGDFHAGYRGRPGTWCKVCFSAHHRGEEPPERPKRSCVVCGGQFRPAQVRSIICSRACKERKRRESGQERESHLLRKYGITQADYDRMLSDQGGGCRLCAVKPEELTTGRYRTYLHVDHCHDSGQVRGLLCPDCNLLVGRRPVEWFRRAADYLER